jgi:acetyltransferase
MLERIRRAAPGARITGFTVQPMIRRPNAQELIIGMSEDLTFGPTLMFGAGGTAVEVLRDTSIALPPLDMKLAADLIQRTRVSRLLAGYRDRPRADLDAVASTLVKVSQLVIDHPQVLELDINPLIADDRGVIALDARVKIAAPGAPARKPLSLRPYPAQWERRIEAPGLGDVQIRPIRPEDEHLYEEFFTHVTAEDSRMRFFTPTRGLSHKFLARLTQIDYAREIAFVAIGAGGHLLGVARFNADPDYVKAEYGVMVRSDLKGKGLGWKLMSHLIRYAKAEGLSELNGVVLAENTTMLDMCRQLGFAVHGVADDTTVRDVVLDLAKWKGGENG